MTQSRTLPSASLRPADLSRLKVLVADDHVLTARLVGDVLRAAGVGQVETAPDGLRAREVIKAWDPHIVFTDWKMPVMDGLELTRSIRRAAVTRDKMVPNPEVPVIMLTALRRRGEVEVARRAGVNEFVIKPFTPASIISRIEIVLKKPRPFVVSEPYIGPDRRRRVELSYSGPLRRSCDPAEVVEAVERQTTRETMGVEIEALRRLIAVRGGMDRETLQMTYRVLQHTRFRARQVRDQAVEYVSQLMIDYVEAMGGPAACDPAMLVIHVDALRSLLAQPETDEVLTQRVMRELKAAVDKMLAQGRRAA